MTGFYIFQRIPDRKVAANLGSHDSHSSSYIKFLPYREISYTAAAAYSQETHSSGLQPCKSFLIKLVFHSHNTNIFKMRTGLKCPDTAKISFIKYIKTICLIRMNSFTTKTIIRSLH